MNISITKKFGATAALLALLGIGIVGCSTPEPADSPASTGNSAENERVDEVEDMPEPVSLEGEWKQTNSDDPERWQTASITGDAIEVYWVADAGDTTALYWAGSLEIPSDADTFTFDSVNDTTKTANAILASGAETKTFSYENGELSYDVTVQNVTRTVRLGQE